MGYESVPDLPTLILAPVTLIAQWRNELELYLDPLGYELHVYDGSEVERRQFFKPNGPWRKSMEKSRRRTILLAAMPVRKRRTSELNCTD